MTGSIGNLINKQMQLAQDALGKFRNLKSLVTSDTQWQNLAMAVAVAVVVIEAMQSGSEIKIVGKDGKSETISLPFGASSVKEVVSAVTDTVSGAVK